MPDLLVFPPDASSSRPSFDRKLHPDFSFACITSQRYLGARLRAVHDGQEEAVQFSSWLATTIREKQVNTTKSTTLHWPASHLAKINQFSVIVNGSAITRVTEFKYSGVIFDEHLSWNKHVESIVSKAGIVGLTRRYTTHTANAICIAMIRPKVTKTSNSDTAMKALRPSFRTRRDEHILKLVMKCIDGRCNIYFVFSEYICTSSTRKSTSLTSAYNNKNRNSQKPLLAVQFFRSPSPPPVGFEVSEPHFRVSKNFWSPPPSPSISSSRQCHIKWTLPYHGRTAFLLIL